MESSLNFTSGYNQTKETMLIFRYLAKEVFTTLTGLTTILMLIFMSNQVVIYLNRAASGTMPGMLIMKLMLLEMPNLLGLLLPLGFFTSLLLAYGRLYAESEMTVLQACGYGTQQLLKHSLIMATLVAFITATLMALNPDIAAKRARLLQTTGIKTLIQTIVPSRFRSFSNGDQVFYVESVHRDHTSASHIFLARLIQTATQPQWDIVWVDRAYLKENKQNGEDYVVLQEGRKYQGQPGQADYQIAEFKQYEARLPHPEISFKKDTRAIPFKALWPFNNRDRSKAAELQWRLSIPLMVFTLTLVAVPLSRVNPRAGKFGKLLPAIVLFFVYANLMFISRDWLAAGKTPVWFGIGWLHLLIILLGLGLIWRERAVSS
jgi:lipopolysaccharide export system permease protein